MSFLIMLFLAATTQTKPNVVNIAKYQGVAPPSPLLPKILPKPGGTCTLVWPGFQVRPGKKKVSRFFFLFTTRINLTSQYMKDKKINYLRLTVPNCQAWSKNAWRDLITHFFKTPVEKVSFFTNDKKTDLIIDLEYKTGVVKPSISHSDFNGYYLLLIEFPEKGLPASTVKLKTAPDKGTKK
ncbi:MAG: hypothetical protein JXR95_11450 [Deltaproteobacteria bacterium]|nr:hypothetical protein [Deltaproteobacteria bacterium]